MTMACVKGAGCVSDVWGGDVALPLDVDWSVSEEGIWLLVSVSVELVCVAWVVGCGVEVDVGSGLGGGDGAVLGEGELVSRVENGAGGELSDVADVVGEEVVVVDAVGEGEPVGVVDAVDEGEPVGVENEVGAIVGAVGAAGEALGETLADGVGRGPTEVGKVALADTLGVALGVLDTSAVEVGSKVVDVVEFGVLVGVICADVETLAVVVWVAKALGIGG